MVEAAGVADSKPRVIRSVAGHNLTLVIPHLIGAGTLKEAAAHGRLLLIAVYTEETLAIVFVAVAELCGEGEFGFLILAVSADPS